MEFVCSRSPTSIRVRLPPNNYQSKGPQLKNKIWIYFQKYHVSGGCEVEDVNIIFEDACGLWMTVSFAEPSGVQQVLANTHLELEIGGFPTRLEVYPDELPRVRSSQDGSITSVHSNVESYLKSFVQINVENISQKLASNQSSLSHQSGQTCLLGHSSELVDKIRQATFTEMVDMGHSTDDVHELSVPLFQRGVGIDEQEELSEDAGSDDGEDGDDDDDDDDDDSQYANPEFDEDQLPSSSGEGKPQNSDREDNESVVEVTDFKPTTSDEMLRLYFENPHKSGGGDIKAFEHDPKTGAIIMTFENPSVAQSVTTRSHRVDGVPLSVQKIVKNKPHLHPVKKRCLFLSGIPDGCDLELVTMFIENRSGTDEVKIQYGEVPGTALCTFTENLPDTERVIKSISTKKLQGSLVTAEKVHESDSILVQGVSPKAHLEMIELYFDNKKKSGGSGVREVQQGPTDTQAIVYFEDWTVVGDVLSKGGPHKVGGVEISVEEYHQFLGRPSSLDVPTPHVPKPVTVQVSVPIMEFIFGKGQHTKKTLIQRLRGVKAILKWPEGDVKTTARLEPLPEDGQQQSSWLKWSETATKVLTDFLLGCKSSRIAVPPPLWKEVIDIMNQLDTKSFSVQPNASRHIVHLFGERQDVDNGRTDIEGVIEELRAKAEYDDQQTKQDINLTEEQHQPFIICGIKEEIEKDFPNLKITVISLQDKTRLVFEGSHKIVQEAELSMRRQMDGLEKVELKTAHSKAKFVRNHSDKIHKILRSRGIRAACKGSDDGKIIICSATKMDAVQAKRYIDQEIEEDVIPIKDQVVLSVLKSQEGRDLLDISNEQKCTVVNINQTEDLVELVGFKTSLEELKHDILAFLAINVVNKDFIKMSKSKMDVLLKRHGKSLDSVAEQHNHNHVKIVQESGSKTGFSIQGNGVGLAMARRFVNSLAEGMIDTCPESGGKSDEQGLLRQDVEMKVDKQVSAAAKPRKKVFASAEAKIDPLYFNIMPLGATAGFSERLEKLANVEVDRTHAGKISCSQRSQLELVVREVCGLVMSHVKYSMSSEDGGFEAAGASNYELNSKPVHMGLVENKYREDDKMEVAEENEERLFLKQSDGPEDFVGDHSTPQLQSASTKEECDDKSQKKQSSLSVRVDETSKETDVDNVRRLTNVDNLVGLDKFTYAYLQQFEGEAFTKLTKRNMVQVKVVQGHASEELDGFIIPSSEKTSALNVSKAKDEFISFYQKLHYDIERKMVDCSSVDAPSIDKATTETIRQFKADTLITKVDGSPHLRFILRRGNVDEVARQFRKIAGIKSRKTLRNAGAGVHGTNDTRSDITDSTRFGADNPEVRSKDGQHDKQPNHNPRLASGSLNDDMKFTTNEGMHIAIRTGDITKQSAIAVVCPSDQYLTSGGGVAKAIIDAAGAQLKDHCRKLMRGRNPLQMNECVITPGFSLGYHVVIHVSGPTKTYQQQFKSDLYYSFLNCLRIAERDMVSSLAIPLMGSGSIGAPKMLCADALVFALIDFSRESQGSIYVREVFLVNIDEISSKAIQQSIQAVFNRQNDFILNARHVGSSDRSTAVGSGGSESTHAGGRKPTKVDQNTPLLSSGFRHPVQDGSKQGESKGQLQKDRQVIDRQPGIQHLTVSEWPKLIESKDQNKNNQKSEAGGAAAEDEAYGNRQGDNPVYKPVESTRHRGGPQDAKPGAQPTTDDTKYLCPICLEDKMINVVALKCKHKFCKACIDEALRNSYKCPVCQIVLGPPKGNQHGTMRHDVDQSSQLSGYDHDGVITTRDQGGPQEAKLGAQPSTDDRKDECPICLADKMINEVALGCKHKFCKACIDEALKNSYRCPVCQKVCSPPKGNQPDGTMRHDVDQSSHLSGFDHDGVITTRDQGGPQEAKLGAQPSTDNRKDECPICLADNMINEVALRCKHKFCKACIDEALRNSYRCPVCQIVLGPPKGNQHGTMRHDVDQSSQLSEYDHDGVITTRDQGGPQEAKLGAQPSTDNRKDECPICLADNMINEVALRCKHTFCKACIDEALKNSYRCPVCQIVCSPPKGNQPDGTMRHDVDQSSYLSGFDHDGVITIRYHIPGGTQKADHPNPGNYFSGTSRTAYLPDNREGREVLALLRKAFDAGLVFTVGQSIISGLLRDTVTWNDIHHKTSKSGGPRNYGYPDPDYLKRVKEDLAAKGIK